MSRWSGTSWVVLLLLVFGCSERPSPPAQQPATTAPSPSGPPVIQLWNDGTYLLGIKPFVLFAAWEDGTVLRRVDGRPKVGKVTPQAIAELLGKVDKAGFFTPALDHGIAVPDGPCRSLAATHRGRKMKLFYNGQTDFNRVGPHASPSRQQFEAFAAMWQHIRKAIDAVQPAEMHDPVGQLDLRHPSSRTAPP